MCVCFVLFSLWLLETLGVRGLGRLPSLLWMWTCQKHVVCLVPKWPICFSPHELHETNCMLAPDIQPSLKLLQAVTAVPRTGHSSLWGEIPSRCRVLRRPRFLQHNQPVKDARCCLSLWKASLFPPKTPPSYVLSFILLAWSSHNVQPPRVFEARVIGCSKNSDQKEIWSREWASSFFCHLLWTLDFRIQKGSSCIDFWSSTHHGDISQGYGPIKATILGPTLKVLGFRISLGNERIGLSQVEQQQDCLFYTSSRLEFSLKQPVYSFKLFYFSRKCIQPLGWLRIHGLIFSKKDPWYRDSTLPKDQHTGEQTWRKW